MTKAAAKPKKRAARERARLILELELDGVKYEIDLFDLRAGERMEIERHAEMPWIRILREGWIESETVLTYAAYLAVRRKGVTAPSFDEFLEQLDEHKASVTIRAEAPDERPADAEAEGERPTETQPTTGSQS